MSLVADQILDAAKEQYERAMRNPSETSATLAVAAALLAIAERLKDGQTW